ncbi:helix-turn-helix domain-containing protein [Actinomyces bowdenii]|nr:helix-turn-helix domain-containing protein [Actinomyces bowdenii]
MVDLWPVTGWTPDGDVDDAGGLESWGEDRGSWDADPWQAPGDRPEAGRPGTGVPAARVGVSQAEIAKILGFSRSAVSLRYRGRVEWGITEVELVAWYLNLPFTDLFHRRASPSRGPFL